MAGSASEKLLSLLAQLKRPALLARVYRTVGQFASLRIRRVSIVIIIRQFFTDRASTPTYLRIRYAFQRWRTFGLRLLGFCAEFKGELGPRTLTRPFRTSSSARIWRNTVLLKIASSEKIECVWGFLKERDISSVTNEVFKYPTQPRAPRPSQLRTP